MLHTVADVAGRAPLALAMQERFRAQAEEMFLGRACGASDLWALGVMTPLDSSSPFCRPFFLFRQMAERRWEDGKRESGRVAIAECDRERYECLSGSLPFFSQSQDRRRAFQELKSQIIHHAPRSSGNGERVGQGENGKLRVDSGRLG